MNGDAVVTAVFGVLALVNTWLVLAVRNAREELGALRNADNLLSERLAQVQVLVAGQYVTRAEFQSEMRHQTATIVARLDILSEQKSGHR